MIPLKEKIIPGAMPLTTDPGIWKQYFKNSLQGNPKIKCNLYETIYTTLL